MSRADEASANPIADTHLQAARGRTTFTRLDPKSSACPQHARRAAAPTAAREGGGADWDVPGEEEDLPVLPALDQVTGWSKAEPDRARATYNPDLALFGGWRLRDWKKREGKR